MTWEVHGEIHPSPSTILQTRDLNSQTSEPPKDPGPVRFAPRAAKAAARRGAAPAPGAGTAAADESPGLGAHVADGERLEDPWFLGKPWVIHHKGEELHWKFYRRG